MQSQAFGNDQMRSNLYYEVMLGMRSDIPRTIVFQKYIGHKTTTNKTCT